MKIKIFILIIISFIFNSCIKETIKLDSNLLEIYNIYDTDDSFKLLKNKKDTLEYNIVRKKIEKIREAYSSYKTEVGEVAVNNDTKTSFIHVSPIEINSNGKTLYDGVYVNFYYPVWISFEIWCEPQQLNQYVLDTVVVNNKIYTGKIYAFYDSSDTLYLSTTDGVIYMHITSGVNDDIYELIK